MIKSILNKSKDYFPIDRIHTDEQDPKDRVEHPPRQSIR